MAHLITLTSLTASKMLDTCVDALDTGAAAHIKFYDAADNEIADATCNDPAFGAATVADPSVATLDIDPAVSDAAAGDAGTVTYFKMLSSSNVEIFRGLVGTTASCDLQFTSNIIGTGEAVTVTAFTLSMPCTPA